MNENKMTKVEKWIYAWLELAEAIVAIVTLGFVTPYWSEDYQMTLIVKE